MGFLSGYFQLALIQDGKPGKDGQDGSRGPMGAKPRFSEWVVGKNYYEGASNEEFYDMVDYDGFLYLCTTTHTSNSSYPPPKSSYWQKSFSQPFLTANTLAAQTIYAGKVDCSGTTTTNTLVAQNVDISGKITATEGVIGGFTISGNTLYCETSKAQELIHIKAGSNDFKLQNSISSSPFIEIKSFMTYAIKIDNSSYGAGIHITGSNSTCITAEGHVSIGGKLTIKGKTSIYDGNTYYGEGVIKEVKIGHVWNGSTWKAAILYFAQGLLYNVKFV